jgi:uncharacterized protein involved in tolerance to divalent cations
MSNLLNYLSRGINPDKNPSINEIIGKWTETQLLEGLYYEDRVRTAISFEVVLRLFDIKNVFYENESEDRFYTVILPIVRVVISKSKNEESHKHVLEILSIAKKMLSSNLAKNINMGVEYYCIYFWNNIVEKSDGWLPYNEHISRIKKRISTRSPLKEIGPDISLIDWEAEYTLYVANTIVKIMDDKIKK